MITAEEARDRIGSGVVYQPYPDAPREDGEVVRVSDAGWVFVRYSGDSTPKATRPEDLEWLATVTAPKCGQCGRERTIRDAYDYNALQVITGQPLGWYSSAEEGDLCPECMTELLRRQ